MENKVKTEPALTPGEWSGEETVVLGIGRPELGYFISIPEWQGDEYHAYVVRGNSISWDWNDNERHRMAATCLYKRPFGFTAQDAERLRTIHLSRPEWQEWLENLAARIEALLPPSDDPRTIDGPEE